MKSIKVKTLAKGWDTLKSAAEIKGYLMPFLRIVQAKAGFGITKAEEATFRVPSRLRTHVHSRFFWYEVDFSPLECTNMNLCEYLDFPLCEFLTE